jgi:hypothetical protein
MGFHRRSSMASPVFRSTAAIASRITASERFPRRSIFTKP